MIQPGLLLQNRYLVKRLLGEGGFGQTWEVEDGGTRKVLKVLRKNYYKAIELFQQEAEVLKKLNHPGIPKVEEDGYFTFQPAGHSQPLHCLVMEFIEGQDIEKWMEQQQYKPITQKQALKWLRQLVEILEQVHAQSYFHRDIKPSNIMRKEDGQLKLIDFGTARELTETYAPKAERGDVTKISSGGYTAPEQLKGRAVPESDIFALGRTFVNLLTGKNISDLFKDPRRSGRLWRDSAPHISKPLLDLIEELMEPLPDRRPKTQEILNRLTWLSIRLSIEPELENLPSVGKLFAEWLLQSEFRRWVRYDRVPKIGLYGKAGAGKSSLINAIVEDMNAARVNVAEPGTTKHEWHQYRRDGWRIDFVDSRGVRDAGGDATFEKAINYIAKARLDVLLFVIEVGARDVQKDLDFLRSLKDMHKKKQQTELPVILVLNKIDAVEPEGWNPKEDYRLSLTDEATNIEPRTSKEAKEANIRACIKKRTQEYKELANNYIPVSAKWNKWEDKRYNIKLLREKIYDSIDDEVALYGFGATTRDQSLKKAIASQLIGPAALWVYGSTLQQVTFDANSVLKIQKRLVSMIAAIAGTNDDKSIIAENFLKQLEADKIDTKASAFSSTFAIGEAAISHFIDGEKLEKVKPNYVKENQQEEPEFQKAIDDSTEEVMRKIRKKYADMHSRYGRDKKNDSKNTDDNGNSKEDKGENNDDNGVSQF